MSESRVEELEELLNDPLIDEALSIANSVCANQDNPERGKLHLDLRQKIKESLENG
jgi:hypothetical protein